MTNLTTGDRVVLAAIDGAEEAAGTVRDVDGSQVLVRTDDGGTEWVDAAQVLLDPDAQCREHGCARRECDADHAEVV